MKSAHRFLSFLLTGILLLACENEQQTWLSEMEGTPACTVPATIGKNLPVTLSAGGITTPGNVVYTWKAPEFSPETYTGTTFEATAPGTVGEHHIFITAHSAGYRDVTIKQKIIVVDCIPMTGHLDIIAPADVVKEETVQFNAIGITSPAEGITYEWSAPGFSPESYTGAIFATQAPEESKTYTITVTAKAENYCDTTIHKEILVKPGRKMQGLFDFTPSSDPIIQEQKVTFTAHGIITPTAEKIIYTWTAPGFTAGTASGNSYTAICPSVAKTYPVSVTAKAPGYTDSTRTRDINIVEKLPMTGDISIAVPPEVIISQPATFHVINMISTPKKEEISFLWNAPYFTPSTYQSTDLTFTATAAPDTEGPYTITVTAQAANYSGKEAEVSVNVKGGMDMTGTLDFNVPGQIVKDMEATFSINSTLATKDGSSITYEWDAPGFSAATFGGPTFTGIPATAGSHTIVLRATAAGHTTLHVSKTVDVIEGLDMGALGISPQGGTSNSFEAGINTVTFIPNLDPSIQNVTYTWSAPGCTPNSYTGAEYKPTLPPVAGAYTVTLTASATGYHQKQATYGYAITCKQMPLGFNLTRTELLLTGDVTTLTATSVNGASYEWIIPTEFAITDGNSTSSSVTIKAPSTPLAHPATITLNAKAVNYCDASHTATVTVKECYPSTYTPVINSSATFENGAFHASNLQDVEFSTLPITPLRSGGTATYAWSFGTPPSSSRSFTPSNSPAATDTSFITKAPGHSTDVYKLTLQVAADGYCAFEPVSKPVVVDASKGSLTGTIEISEVVAPTSDPTKPVLWIAKDRPVTLHAHYSTGSGETTEELDLKFRWYWVNGANYTLLGENDGTLNYTPQTEVHDNRIKVEVYDLNGKAAITKDYPYYVQNCSNNLLPGLHINVNYQCRVDGLRSSAFVMDSLDNHYIYKVTNIGGKWWLTENLRANKQGNAYTGYIDVYGAYYPAGVVAALGSTDGRYCPKGWRIPTKDEWNALNNAVDPSNNESVFNGLATSEKDTNPSVGSTAWNSSNVTNLPGSNTVGFNLIPAGIRYNSSITQWGNRAMFFIYGGSEVQSYGPISPPGKGTATQPAIDNNYWYTARCVND